MTERTAGGGLRERTRDVLRTEISNAAMSLFLDRGFEQTTIADIAAATGISRRSLFRYFPTKEDIVLSDLSRQGAEITQSLRERPDDEPPWDALRAALRILGRSVEADTGLRFSEMLLDTPTLRARRAEKYLDWQVQIVPEIERRMGVRSPDGTDPRARALVACALSCLDVATETWTRRGGQGPSIEKIFDDITRAVRTT